MEIKVLKRDKYGDIQSISRDGEIISVGMTIHVRERNGSASCANIWEFICEGKEVQAGWHRVAVSDIEVRYPYCSLREKNYLINNPYASDGAKNEKWHILTT